MKASMIGRSAAAVLVALAALLAAGCVPTEIAQTDCRLAEGDPTRLVCDGREYALLADTVPNGQLGPWKGTLRAIVAFDEEGREVARVDAVRALADLPAFAEQASSAVRTTSFGDVFERRGDAEELIVQVDGRNHRTVATSETDGALLLA